MKDSKATMPKQKVAQINNKAAQQNMHRPGIIAGQLHRRNK